MHLPPTPDTRFIQGLPKSFPVSIILENGFTPISPIHHVIDRPRIFHSEFSRRQRQSNAKPILVNHKN